ncbi:MAG: IS1182 family transposase [Chloroflexi bacterium]|nr:IS1182 family transposase [Chloroflexota bacterium]
MSLKSQGVPSLPEETARVVRRVFPKGNLYITIGDQIGVLFEDTDFADMYAREGKPAIAPYVLAMVSIFQFMEDLSDREAADAVRARMDWKYALHLPLDDPGFDFSVLSEFRQRVLAHDKGVLMFERVLQRLEEMQLLRKRGKQRTDSTHVLGASRRLSRLELVVETMRVTLEGIARVAPEWLQREVPAEWYQRYHRAWRSLRFPKKQEDRDALLLRVGEDGYALLERVNGPETPEAVQELAVMDTLRRVWEQEFMRDEAGVHVREPGQRVSGEAMIVTPHDEEVRRSTHGALEWHGYRLHWTETCDEGQPRLITHVAVTPATTPDVVMLPKIHQALAEQGRVPGIHLVDGGYVAGHVLAQAETQYGIDVVGPAPKGTHWQARTPGGFTLEHFHVDWEKKQATCPQGHNSVTWSESHNERGYPVVHIGFAKSTCDVCPVRSKCTRSRTGGRRLKVLRTHEYLRQARKRQKTPEFQQMYKQRAGVEGTVSVTVQHHGMRRSRYVGLKKTQLQALFTAMAVNLKQAARWLMGVPPASTRSSPLDCLILQPI